MKYILIEVLSGFTAAALVTSILWAFGSGKYGIAVGLIMLLVALEGKRKFKI